MSSRKANILRSLSTESGGTPLALAFRQEVRKEYRQARGYSVRRQDQPAALSFKGKAERRTVRIVNVVLLERKKITVATDPVYQTNSALVKVDSQHV